MYFNKFALPLALITGALLTGCVTQQQVTLGGGQVAPSRVVTVVRSSAPSPGPHTFNLSKTVASGTNGNMGGVLAVNPDCSPHGLSTIDITQKPVHGTATVVKRDEYPNYPASNPRSSCNKHKVPGIFVQYTPNDDFSGADFMTYEIITPEGQDSIWNVSITVK